MDGWFVMVVLLLLFYVMCTVKCFVIAAAGVKTLYTIAKFESS